MPCPRPRLVTLRAALLAALLTTALTACGTGHSVQQDAAPPSPEPAPSLPDATGLLADSAVAMRAVSSTRVSIVVEGTLRGVPIRSAEAQLTRDGEAKGTARANQAGQVVELTFVIIDDSLYLRGPTTGYRQMPLTSVGLLYNPSKVLAPDAGVAAVLASGAAAKTLGREVIGGVDSYRVRASFSGESLANLVPGFTADSTGDVWISATDHRLVQAWLPHPEGAIAFQFSDYDAPADIRAPI